MVVGVDGDGHEVEAGVSDGVLLDGRPAWVPVAQLDAFTGGRKAGEPRSLRIRRSPGR